MSKTQTTSTATEQKPTEPPKDKGADLRPNIDFGKGGPDDPSITDRKWFWVGALPSCPVLSVAIGGTTFATHREEVSDRQGGAPSKRVPKIGVVMHLSEAQIQTIREALPLHVVRFTEAPKDLPPEYCGVEVLDQYKPRKGHPLRISTKAELEKRREKGYPAQGYTPREWDEALADHVFIIPCPNQAHPSDGNHYPEPVSKTGLSWE